MCILCIFDFPYPSHDVQLEQTEHHQKNVAAKILAQTKTPNSRHTHLKFSQNSVQSCFSLFIVIIKLAFENYLYQAPKKENKMEILHDSMIMIL